MSAAADALPAAAQAALAALATRYGLDAGQRDQLAALLGLLESEEHAPTAVREPLQAVQAHLADSLVALELEGVRRAASIADLGSGAGFPGLALAVAVPAAEVRLVESQGRKCAYLQRAIAQARVANARVVRARVEEWGEGATAQELVLARALAAQPVVLEYAAPLLALGGRLVDWRGRRTPEQERAALAAAAQLGLELEQVRRVAPFAGASDRHLHVYLKVSETPARFPRRPGVARKRPLGA